MEDKSENRVKNIIISLVFIVFVSGIFVAGFLVKDRGFSDNENRNLALVLDINKDAIFDNTISKSFETYVQDQFPARDSFVPLKTRIDLMLGKKDNGFVYFGEDGYLFSIEIINKEQLEKNVGYINSLGERMKPDVKLSVMAVPTAADILMDKLPSNAAVPDEEAAIDWVKKNGDYNFVDVRNALRDRKNEYIFYRTDHHWTTLGAYYAYQVWNRKAPDLKDYEIETVSDCFYGTNHSKAPLKSIQPDSMSRFTLKSDTGKYSMEIIENDKSKNRTMDSLYDESYLDKKDKYSYYLSGNNPVVIIKNNGGTGSGNLMVVKDSFAHCFIPFLAADYQKIVVVDMRYYRNNIMEMIDEQGITEVLFLYNILNLSQDTNMVFLKK